MSPWPRGFYSERRSNSRRARAQSAQDDFDNFTRQENRGKALFMRNWPVKFQSLKEDLEGIRGKQNAKSN